MPPTTIILCLQMKVSIRRDRLPLFLPLRLLIVN